MRGDPIVDDFGRIMEHISSGARCARVSFTSVR
jgi:hypothetical protein